MSDGAATVGLVMADLDTRIAPIAEAALTDRQFVTAIDVLIGLGWLVESRVGLWRRGLVTSLDRCIRADSTQTSDVLDALKGWAEQRGFQRWDTDYCGLRFTADGDTETERGFRTRWAAHEQPEPKTSPPRSREPKLLSIDHAWECGTCGETRELLLKDTAGGICLECVGLAHLVYLPSGDAALTRRTKKASRLTAGVVRWNSRYARYERHGTLTEQRAIEQAARECLQDNATRLIQADLRGEIVDGLRTQFPGCPPARADAIAYYAAVRGSRRRTRSRTSDPDSIRRAVACSVRHIDTDYDDLLLSAVDPREARATVQDRVDDILNAWSGGVTVLD